MAILTAIEPQEGEGKKLLCPAAKGNF